MKKFQLVFLSSIFACLMGLRCDPAFAGRVSITINVKFDHCEKSFRVNSTPYESSYRYYIEISELYQGSYTFRSSDNIYQSEGEQKFEVNNQILTDHVQHSRFWLSSYYPDCISSSKRLYWKFKKNGPEYIVRFDKDKLTGRKGWRDFVAQKDAYCLLDSSLLAEIFSEVMPSLAEKLANSLRDQGLSYAGDLAKVLSDGCFYFEKKFSTTEDPMVLFHWLNRECIDVNFPAGTFSTFIRLNVDSPSTAAAPLATTTPSLPLLMQEEGVTMTQEIATQPEGELKLQEVRAEGQAESLATPDLFEMKQKYGAWVESIL